MFSLDVYREGMLTVAVLHPPAFGATLASLDAAAALAVPGVERVEEIPTGVAVYARSTYPALKGARGAGGHLGRGGGRDALVRGDVSSLVGGRTGGGARRSRPRATWTPRSRGAATVHEAEYLFPFLAHAPMEPLDGVIELSDGAAEIWMGSQLQTVDHGTLASVLGLPQEAIALHTTFTGGSFGRKAQPSSHFAAELAEVARAAGRGAYKVMWTREDDVRGGWYRPLTVHHLRGGLDPQGNVVAWENRIANQSIIAGGPFEGMMEAGLDPTAYEGSTKMPYAWPAHRVTWAQMRSAVPVLWWRSVGHTHTAYATETFLDELLERAGRDAVEGPARPPGGRGRARPGGAHARGGDRGVVGAGLRRAPAWAWRSTRASAPTSP